MEKWRDPKQLDKNGAPREITVHGFRSSFSDWRRETTNFDRALAEAQLAHINGDRVEGAYARGEQLEKRRKMVAAWSAYCDRPAPTSNVIALRAK